MDLTNVVGVLSPYFTGTVDAWGASWLRRASKAEQEGKELIVIEMPVNDLINCITAPDESLETFLRLDVG
jgi:lysophospholipase L1-like esterase